MSKWFDILGDKNQILGHNKKTNCKLILLFGFKVWIQNDRNYFKIINDEKIVVSINRSWKYTVQDKFGNEFQIKGQEIIND